MKTKHIIFLTIGVIVVGTILFLLTHGRTNAPTVTPSPTGVTGTAVSIRNYQFDPASLIIKKGQTVAWTNYDAAPHVIAGDADGWVAGPAMKQGDTYSHTFDTVGTFAYHCAIHPGMRGTIVVTE